MKITSDYAFFIIIIVIIFTIEVCDDPPLISFYKKVKINKLCFEYEEIKTHLAHDYRNMKFDNCETVSPVKINTLSDSVYLDEFISAFPSTIFMYK